MEEIRFYSSRREHGYLSNFYPCILAVDGTFWASAEHYYQAAKFRGVAGGGRLMRKIQQAPTAKEAARLGRKGSPLRKDWREARIAVMHRTLLLKFTQHSPLRKKLLATAPAHLVEASPSDYFWGDGADGTGENVLGQLLMDVRKMLESST